MAKVSLTNTKLLESTIESKGIKRGFIAEKLNLSRQGLDNKLKGITDFRQTEIDTMCNVLGISGNLKLMIDIFFAHDVEENSTSDVMS
jgi:hypothetical protein